MYQKFAIVNTANFKIDGAHWSPHQMRGRSDQRLYCSNDYIVILINDYIMCTCHVVVKKRAGSDIDMTMTTSIGHKAT